MSCARGFPRGCSRIGYAAAVVGVVAVPAGAAIMLGPSGAHTQGSNASNTDFVGIPIALSFAQAGLILMLGVGMTGFALATLMMSLAARRGALPNWLVVVGVVLAVVTLGSFIWVPGYAFLIWVLIVGIVVGIGDDTAAARG